jgi:hypothetical protein
MSETFIVVPSAFVGLIGGGNGCGAPGSMVNIDVI